jgi:hypothetical protein
VTFGSGTTTVYEPNWGAAERFHFILGHGGGNDTIYGFRGGADVLDFSPGILVRQMTVLGQTARLELSDRTIVTLADFSGTLPTLPGLWSMTKNAAAPAGQALAPLTAGFPSAGLSVTGLSISGIAASSLRPAG